MSGHTPGPWRVEPSYHAGPLGGEGFAIGAVFQWPEGENAFVGLAFTPAKGVGPYGNDHEANASLIAAAPDLLAALKALLKEAESLGFSVDQEFAGFESRKSEDAEAFIAARAAIAKAEGRS